MVPEAKGLYWARVAKQWYLVDWQDKRLEVDHIHYLNMPAFVRRFDGSMALTSIDPIQVDEWGARVAEPGEG